MGSHYQDEYDLNTVMNKKGKSNLSVFPLRLLVSRTFWILRMGHEVINDWWNCRDLLWNAKGHRVQKDMTVRETDLREWKAIISRDEVVRTVGKTASDQNKRQIEILMQIIFRLGPPVLLRIFNCKPRNLQYYGLSNEKTSTALNSCSNFDPNHARTPYTSDHHCDHITLNNRYSTLNTDDSHVVRRM